VLKLFVLAVLIALWGGTAVAGAGVGRFDVGIVLRNNTVSGPPDSAFCRIGPSAQTFGSIVTIVCATGAVVNIEAPDKALPWVPLHGGAYRFSRLTSTELLGMLGMQFPGAIDSYTGLGTVTSWRHVNLGDREYLEMLLGW
jgi:hypothetical protein